MVHANKMYTVLKSAAIVTLHGSVPTVNKNTESVQCLIQLHYMNFDVKSGCRTASSVSVSNSVQIYAKWQTFGQNLDFKYGGRYHLGFCGISSFLVKPVTGPTFCFCVKFGANLFKTADGRLTDFKTAAAAILDFCTT